MLFSHVQTYCTGKQQCLLVTYNSGEGSRREKESAFRLGLDCCLWLAGRSLPQSQVTDVVSKVFGDLRFQISKLEKLDMRVRNVRNLCIHGAFTQRRRSGRWNLSLDARRTTHKGSKEKDRKTEVEEWSPSFLRWQFSVASAAPVFCPYLAACQIFEDCAGEGLIEFNSWCTSRCPVRVLFSLSQIDDGSSVLRSWSAHVLMHSVTRIAGVLCIKVQVLTDQTTKTTSTWCSRLFVVRENTQPIYGVEECCTDIQNCRMIPRVSQFATFSQVLHCSRDVYSFRVTQVSPGWHGVASFRATCAKVAEVDFA